MPFGGFNRFSFFNFSYFHGNEMDLVTLSVSGVGFVSGPELSNRLIDLHQTWHTVAPYHVDVPFGGLNRFSFFNFSYFDGGKLDLVTLSVSGVGFVSGPEFSNCLTDLHQTWHTVASYHVDVPFGGLNRFSFFNISYFHGNEKDLVTLSVSGVGFVSGPELSNRLIDLHQTWHTVASYHVDVPFGGFNRFSFFNFSYFHGNEMDLVTLSVSGVGFVSGPELSNRLIDLHQTWHTVAPYHVDVPFGGLNRFSFFNFSYFNGGKLDLVTLSVSGVGFVSGPEFSNCLTDLHQTWHTVASYHVDVPFGGLNRFSFFNISYFHGNEKDLVTLSVSGVGFVS